MIKQNILMLFITLFMFSCNTQNNQMEIRYTSINDYYADYVFNFNNSKTGLALINNYALTQIEAQKKTVDSVKQTTQKTPATIESLLNNGSFSQNAENIALYTPPSEISLNKVNNKDLIIKYIVGENTFKVEDIQIGESYKNTKITVEATTKNNQSELKLNVEALTIEALSQILNKIESVNHHKQNEQYIYAVLNSNNVEVMSVLFSNKGQNINLKYH